MKQTPIVMQLIYMLKILAKKKYENKTDQELREKNQNTAVFC